MALLIGLLVIVTAAWVWELFNHKKAWRIAEEKHTLLSQSDGIIAQLREENSRLAEEAIEAHEEVGRIKKYADEVEETREQAAAHHLSAVEKLQEELEVATRNCNAAQVNYEGLQRTDESRRQILIQIEKERDAARKSLVDVRGILAKEMADRQKLQTVLDNLRGHVVSSVTGALNEVA